MDSVILKPPFGAVPPISFNDASPTPAKNYKRQILRGYQMHRALAWCVGVVVALSLVGFAMMRGPYYEVSALVYVQPEKARVVTDPTEGAYDSMRYDSYIEQQLQTILRSDVLTAALIKANTRAGREVWTFPGEAEHAAVVRLQKSLKVEREKGSYQLAVTLSGRDPAAITTLLNSVVETYIGKERLDELAQNDQQLQLLKEERVRVTEELDHNQHEQAQLSKDLGVADLGSSSGKDSTGNQFDTELAQLRNELAQARAARTAADAQLASVADSPTEDSQRLIAAAEQTIENDPGLAALKETISRRRSELATQMAGLTQKNPLFKQDQDELKRLNQSLDEMSNELRAKAEQQVLDKRRLQAALARDVEARVESELQAQIMIATGATTKLQRASFLAANILRLQARFTELDNAVNALELEHGSTGLVHLLVPAEQPPKPKVSKRWFILAAALPFGLIFGLLAALFRHKADPRIYIAEDVSSVAQFPPIAVLPALGATESKMKDEFMLRLVAGIDQAHASGGAKTIVFSAVSPDTNITELVTSLASAMELLGCRIKILNSAGLQNPTTEGERAKNSSGRELQLARMTEFKRASSLVESLKRLEHNEENVDMVFLEGSPLLFSAETEFAARLADITVLVIQSASTTRQEMASSLALARRLNLKGIAAVLIDLDMKHADSEFLAVVRAARKRQVEKRMPSEPRSRRLREKYPLSIYPEPAALSQDNETRRQL
jgi:uncharacterized protein involved in exopolysaccharide biosynthesis